MKFISKEKAKDIVKNIIEKILDFKAIVIRFIHNFFVAILNLLLRVVFVFRDLGLGVWKGLIAIKNACVKFIKRFIDGSIWTKLSHFIMGLGNIARGQIVKGVLFLGLQILFITFMVVFAISVFLISFENKDFTTNFTSVAATINNIGPGLSLVGPTQNFAHFSIFSKYVFMIDMLAGRLELFPLLILFHPSVWKELS